jgi:methanogenic corrinoid protein MtbC1
MNKDTYQLVKEDSQKFLPASEAAVIAFEQAFPKILSLVNDKFAIETKFTDNEMTCGPLCVQKDTHKNFGELLLAIYEFHLYDHLFDEFSWYISSLSSRGFDRDYFNAMIKTWHIAIHSVIKPPESHELARPLKYLQENLSLIYRHANITEVPLSDELRPFIELLIAKNRKDAADYMLSILKKGVSIETIYSDFLTVAMQEIGIRWQKNEMSVVDVHVATDICRYIIMRLVDNMTTEKKLPYRALVTCVPGEEHEMGPELIENYLEMQGWDVYSMGHIAPEDDILEAIITNKPDVVFLSVTLVANLPSAKALAIKIREQVPHAKIVMGGYAAVLAGDTLAPFSDLIVRTIKETHTRSLQLVGSHA